MLSYYGPKAWTDITIYPVNTYDYNNIPVEVVMEYIGYRASIRRLMVTYGCKYISIPG